MREIKFRAFYQGQMFRVTELMWSDETAYLYDEDDNSGFVVPFGDFELMQFTGLLDAKGREIYEGDVIRRAGSKVFHEVKFRDGTFEVSMIPLSHCRANEEVEVVGNIYSNPELLKNV